MNIQSREKSDPHELNNPIPYSVSAVILGLTLWSVSYIFWTSHELEQNSKKEQATLVAQEKTTETPAASSTATPKVAKKSTKTVDGKALYSANCSSCHQATGKGLAGVFPPIDGSNWVTSDNHDLPIQIIAKGLNGSIEVAGTTYNGVMPPFGGSLSNDELAALVTYIRGNWSNTASKVTADDVQQSLDTYNEQSAPWNGEAQLIERIGALN